MSTAIRLRAEPSDPVRVRSTSGESERSAVRRAWAALVPLTAEIAEEISAAVLAAPTSGWGASSYPSAPEVRQAIREHLRSGLQTLAGLVDVEHRAVDVWREFGRQQARNNVPLEAILNAYTRGNRVLWETLVRRHREGLLPRVIDDRTLLLAGRSLWNSMDTQNAVLVATYQRELERVRGSAADRRAQVMDGLIDDRGADAEFAREACRLLAVRVGAAVSCVVGIDKDVAGTPAALPGAALERIGVAAHWHARDGHLVGLLVHPQCGVEQVRDALREHSTDRLTIMASRDGVEGFAQAYRLAVRAVETMPAGTAGVENVADRLPHVLLAGNREIAGLLVDQVLGRVMAQPAQQRDVLLDTLSVYLASGLSPTRAAAGLTCHRNTVLYRLKQLAALTPYDPHHPPDLLLLTLALVAVRTELAGHR